MRAYIIATIFISSWHIYFSIEKSESPINILFLIFILVPFVPYIWKEIENVKLGKDGFELQRLKSEVDKTIKHAVHEKSIPPSALDSLFKTVELNEWLTLVLARMLMRQGLVCLVPDHNLGVSPSLQKLIALALERDILSDSEFQEFEKLRNVTFYAEWWDGNVPTHKDWEWSLNNCKLLIKQLFEKQLIT